MLSPANPDAITAVPGIRVGHWSDTAGITGCTVVRCDRGAVPGYCSLGGAPGSIETELLKPENTIARAHAVLLTGGSAFGLAAATGVREALRDRGIGQALAIGVPRIPIVLGAVLFDLRIGSAEAFPDAAAGRRATERAQDGAVLQGSVGAGVGCTVAKTGGLQTALKGGIGSAALAHGSGLVVGALAAVNGIGDVYDTGGKLIAAPRGQRPGEMCVAADLVAQSAVRDADATGVDLDSASSAPASEGPTNTTIAVVATNARLDKAQATRLAIMADDGLGRAIRPAHTPLDGDSIFVLATGDDRTPMTLNRIALLGVMAAETISLAIQRGVTAATALGDVPTAHEWTRRT